MRQFAVHDCLKDFLADLARDLLRRGNSVFNANSRIHCSLFPCAYNLCIYIFRNVHAALRAKGTRMACPYTNRQATVRAMS